jgi:hypothetical protein
MASSPRYFRVILTRAPPGNRSLRGRIGLILGEPNVFTSDHLSLPVDGLPRKASHWRAITRIP